MIRTLGRPGHFICNYDCAFFICQENDQYRVSTIGDYHPNVQPRHRCDETRTGLAGKARLTDPDMNYETYVFDRVDGQNVGAEIDGERYETEGEAAAGHDRYVRKYLGWLR